MKRFQVKAIFEIEAAQDESADNKLDVFLSGLDLKKNERVDLVDLGELVEIDDDEDGSEIKSEGSGKQTPPLEMPKEEAWDDDWEDLDFDTLDEDEEDDEDEEEDEIEEEDDVEEEAEKEEPLPEDEDVPDEVESEEVVENEDKSDDLDDEDSDDDEVSETPEEEVQEDEALTPEEDETEDSEVKSEWEDGDWDDWES
jgi:hypothetical protein